MNTKSNSIAVGMNDVSTSRSLKLPLTFKMTVTGESTKYVGSLSGSYTLTTICVGGVVREAWKYDGNFIDSNGYIFSDMYIAMANIRNSSKAMLVCGSLSQWTKDKQIDKSYLKTTLEDVSYDTAIYTPGTKVLGMFTNRNSTEDTAYRGVIGEKGYNAASNTYEIRFDDGDCRTTFRAEDVRDAAWFTQTKSANILNKFIQDDPHSFSWEYYNGSKWILTPNITSTCVITEDTPPTGVTLLDEQYFSQIAENIRSTRIGDRRPRMPSVYDKFKLVKDNIVKGNIVEAHTTHPTPKGMNIELKVHQQRMLYEMIQKEQTSFRFGNKLNMFVLSDKVGSGKSLDILALIRQHPTLDTSSYYNIHTMNHKLPNSYKSRFTSLQLTPSVVFKTNLIVIPHNIFNQWREYITTLTNLTVYSIHIRKKIKTLSLQHLIDGKYNIVLIKSTMYNDLMRHIYTTYPFNGKLIDTRIDALTDVRQLHRLTTKIKNTLECLVTQESMATHGNYTTLLADFKKLQKLSANTDIEPCVRDILHLNTNELTYTIRKLFQYSGPIFERVIFDEANSIKIPSCKPAFGKVNWFVTSSVEDLLYPYGKNEVINPDASYSNRRSVVTVNGITGTGFVKDTFIRNSTRYLYESIQNTYLKNNNTFIENSFALPETINHTIKCWTPPELLVLNGIASPAVIQALNAGDSESAIRMTNCNVSNELDIVEITLSSLHTSLEKYTKLLEEKNTIKHETQTTLDNELSSTSAPNNEIVQTCQRQLKNVEVSIKNFIDKKKNLQFKIEALKERVSNVQEKTCPICLCEVTNPCVTDCCQNIYCMGCYIRALESTRQKCPHCRAPNRKISNVTLISNNVVKQPKLLPEKSEELLRIIASKPDGRFLIFSEYDNTFRNILSLLEKHHINYNKLTGSSGRVTNIIKDFKDNRTNVLLLNAKNYGSGLNLQMTTDIIMYHKMSTDLEKQVIGRGQRPGRTEALHVHYLCYENEC